MHCPPLSLDVLMYYLCVHAAYRDSRRLLDPASGFDRNDLEAQGKTLNTQNAPQAALPSSLSQPFILP